MTYLIAEKTVCGRRHPVNEDALLVMSGQIGPDELVFALVCDGVGGLANGHVASHQVVCFCENWFQSLLRRVRVSHLQILHSLEWAVHEMNATIHDQNIYQSQMATTFTGVVLFQNLGLICHVGDSALYHLAQKKLTCLTRMHHLCHAPNVLTRAVGYMEKVLVDVEIVALKKAEALILCTDGFYKQGGLIDLQAHLAGATSRDSLEKRVALWVARARAKGQDDVSLVVIKKEG